MKMRKKEFFEKWKGDWSGRKGEFNTDQAELFRYIRDRENLEIRLERRMERIMKELSKGISQEVYPLKAHG
jgi:hypothetical protein